MTPIVLLFLGAMMPISSLIQLSLVAISTSSATAVEQGEKFTLNGTLAVAADTRRARDRVLNQQVLLVWQSIFGGNASNLEIGVARDTANTQSMTSAGVNIRKIQYEIVGVAKTAFDSEQVMQAFRAALVGRPPTNVVAVFTDDGSVVNIGANGSTLSSDAFPKLPEVTTDTAAVKGETETGKIPFTLNDTIAIVADTRRQRDGVFNDQVLPVWKSILGAAKLDLTAVKDVPYSTFETSDGSSIRQIQYEVTGSKDSPVEIETIKQQFRQAAIEKAPPNIWAVSSTGGTMQLLPSSHVTSGNATVTRKGQPQDVGWMPVPSLLD